MISWRYHLVSIIAVFLALALGVLAGTAVVNQGLVHNLQSTTDRLTKETQDYRAKISEITTENRNLTDFSDQARDAIANLRLDQVDVVLVTDEGADPAAIGEARTALLAAGATVVTTLIPLPKVFSADPADQKLLANVIGAPAQSQNVLQFSKGIFPRHQPHDDAGKRVPVLIRYFAGDLALRSQLDIDA